MSEQKTAIGLKYNAPKAPEVVSKGYGDLAEQIIEAANEAGVLVHQDLELSNYLSRLELGTEIPREVYIVIAELIAWSYVIQGKKPEQFNNVHNKVDDLA